MKEITVKTNLPPELVQAVLDEVARAEKKHPYWSYHPVYAAAVVAEESGELIKAALEVKDREKSVKESVCELRTEATQVAAMGMRFLTRIFTNDKSEEYYI